ncbi:erythromycin esterase family protein [Nocardia spumae]|uniref:erythromycin esterase family protein n=1 Tax=Nocardia spumae TaxID=2887190 RepID=UPI001D13D231|nr:erythromycin esterase family protein [Nocardia spumae]
MSTNSTSTATTLRGIGRQLGDSAALGRAVDELLGTRSESPVLFGLGEPTHGIEAFPLLRNEILRHLVDRGYRSIAVETDIFAASVVDDYVHGGTGDIDTVLATGFSHRFGEVPGNRELVEWLRAHNAELPQRDRVRFHGFDAPLEFAAAPSPRRALFAVHDRLPAALRPESARDLDTLLGEEAEWTNEEAMYDPAVSIGDSDRARALRIAADDLAGALRRAAPTLRPLDQAGYDLTAAYARTALGLLRYHAAMASPASDRIGRLLAVRAEMMADNLLALVEQERRHGPTLVFAHNVHLQRAQSGMPVGADEVSWGSAGALVGLALGERYVFVATDARPQAEPDTFQGMLAEATTRRALFPAAELLAALPPSIRTGEPIVRGHIPLAPADVTGADAILFVADTDGKQHRYW